MKIIRYTLRHLISKLSKNLLKHLSETSIAFEIRNIENSESNLSVLRANQTPGFAEIVDLDYYIWALLPLKK